MAYKRLIALALAVGGMALSASRSKAGDLHITIPKRSQSTPVQRLNREGVEAVKKHNYDKARKIFYEAYLLDPDDPFTLNNLGFVAEMDGQVNRAQRFYALAAEQMTEATVARASTESVEGATFKAATSSRQSVAIEINRANFDAIQMLSQQRAPEAEELLQRTLKLDPKNAFTQNNMGVAKEMLGDFDSAQRYYLAASNLQSSEPVIVTLNGNSRGKPVSQVAAANLQKLKDRLATENSAEAQVARLNLQGVVAINRNDWKEAAAKFLSAYKIDPSNAFSLNNLGYLSEMDGDMETAQLFYDRAQIGERSGLEIGTATRRAAEGMRLDEVALESGQTVDAKLQALRDARRRQNNPIVLRHRDDTPVIEPEQPPQATPTQPNNP